MITLVGIGSQYIHQNLGVWCLAAGLEQYGLEEPFEVIEINVNQPLDENIQKIVATAPKVLGFSCYIWNIERAVKLIEAVNLLLPECIIVCGGPEVSFRGESFLFEMPQVNYVLKGEGEYSFYKLCKYVLNKQKQNSLDEIPGLFYREKGKVVETPVKPLPMPAPSPYTKACLEAVQRRIVYVETSRGCPFSCAFCLSGRDDDTVFFNIDQAKKDLILAANSGTTTVKLVDRTFNCNLKRAKELFGFLIEEHFKQSFPNSICFHFEIGADLFDQETLDILAKAPEGLFQVEAGIQSFHEETLLACRRKTNMNKLEYNLTSLLANQNIHVHIDLIAGLPFEDFKTFELSFQKALSIKPHMLQLGFLKLIYGSTLREEKKDHGYISLPYPPYEVLESKWLSFSEMNRLKTAEKGLECFYNKGRFPKTIDKLLAVSEKSPLLFFEQLGKAIDERGAKISFEGSCVLLWDIFSQSKDISSQELGNLLIEDILTYNNTGHIPLLLRTEEDLFKQMNIKVRKKYPKGSKLGIGLLVSQTSKVIVADYTKPAHPVTGQYPVQYYLCDELLTGDDLYEG